MINKIKHSFSELSAISSLIIVHGMRLSCLLMSAGLALCLSNARSGRYSIYLGALSKYISEAAVSIVAIIIIGGLMFDYYSKKYKSEE